MPDAQALALFEGTLPVSIRNYCDALHYFGKLLVLADAVQYLPRHGHKLARNVFSPVYVVSIEHLGTEIAADEVYFDSMKDSSDDNIVEHGADTEQIAQFRARHIL